MKNENTKNELPEGEEKEMFTAWLKSIGWNMSQFYQLDRKERVFLYESYKSRNQKQFYCKRICVDPEFSIIDWNDIYNNLEKMGIKGIEREKVLHPDKFPCINQCESCINTVLDTQKKNKIIRSKNLKNQ